MAWFRAMKRDSDKRPLCGATARMLGVRPGFPPVGDVGEDDAGSVHPGGGGMSVFREPELIPKHRKPAWLPGGEGRDSLFHIDARLLLPGLQVRLDGQPGHAVLEPAELCTMLAFQAALCRTRGTWMEVPCPTP